MTFLLRYQMLSGSASRVVDTIAEAIAACVSIQQAGGRTTSIVDHGGRLYTLDDLRSLAQQGVPVSVTMGKTAPYKP